MASMEVLNREAVVERFGEWPSFHDAEVYSLRLDSGQRTDGLVRLQLDVHVFAVEGRLPSGHLNFVKHTLVTLKFEEVEALEIDSFGPQNVLDGLVLEDVELAAGRQVQVTPLQQRARRQLPLPVGHGPRSGSVYAGSSLRLRPVGLAPRPAGRPEPSSNRGWGAHFGRCAGRFRFEVTGPPAAAGRA